MPDLSAPHHALALDVGGSHVSAALVDLQRRQALPVTRLHTDPDADAGTILDAWVQAARTAHAAGGHVPLAHIGLALPAPFDYRRGISRMQHKFAALYGLNVKEQLRARLRGSALETLDLRLANDADLFALGEAWSGAARGRARVIGITLGTGLGSGFVDRGRVVVEGPEVPPGGELWNTPYRSDIAETFACGAAVTRAYARQGQEALAAAEVARRAETGDPIARQAFAELGHHLGEIIAPWVQRFEPDAIVIGGNVSRAWSLFSPALEAALPGTPCLPSALFEEAALLGAAALSHDSPYPPTR
ncbi:glucokinase [Deinobacterium chartae]|uniref:Glucokinase n=1 Tax=Deinobacterium chartae TaxID=521158 RepID=A0A841HZR5_9DEIO|nr:ROK family protein [Deinobacterium chartae]MBB6097372.1 glucokinase [Deinobacterium chartae]